MYRIHVLWKIRVDRIGFLGTRISLNSQEVELSLFTEQTSTWIKSQRFAPFQFSSLLHNPFYYFSSVLDSTDGARHFIWSTYEGCPGCRMRGSQLWSLLVFTECDYHVYCAKRCAWKSDSVCSGAWGSCNGGSSCNSSSAVPKSGIWFDTLFKMSNKLDAWWYALMDFMTVARCLAIGLLSIFWSPLINALKYIHYMHLCCYLPNNFSFCRDLI